MLCKFNSLSSFYHLFISQVSHAKLVIKSIADVNMVYIGVPSCVIRVGNGRVLYA